MSTTSSFLKLTLLPGITPRIGKLFFSGFDYIAWFIAQAYVCLKILPKNHPYTNPANHGRYSIVNVIGEARRHLVYDRYHLDQIILYYTVIFGFMLLFIQLFMVIAAVAVHTASAAALPATYAGFFVTVNNNTDLAFIMLDLVFGFPGLFDSCAMTGGGPPCPALPTTGMTPFHVAMHTLFEFYNVGLLAVAIIVFLYLFITVVAETAISGEPFGQRFNSAWVPLRLIWVIGMLCPLGFGMNGAQWATLHVAKLGSSVATNSWLFFLNSLGGDTQLGARESLVVVPEAPALNSLVEFLFVTRTCAHYQQLMYGRTINAYLVDGDRSQVYMTYGGAFTTDFDGARAFSNNQNIKIRFGEQSDDYTNDEGKVKPICGTMIFPVVDVTQPGPLDIQRSNFQYVWEIWTDPANDITAMNIVKRWISNELKNPNLTVPAGGGTIPDYVQTTFNDYNTFVLGDLAAARTDQIGSPQWDQRFAELGWAGAAIWYNKLAELNGSFVTAIHSLPRGEKYPEVMEEVAEQKRATDQLIEPMERFKPVRANGDAIIPANMDDFYAQMAYYQAQQMWQAGYQQPQNVSILDTIKSIFGLEDLFNMRNNIAAGVNPLALLTGLGRGLLESAIQNIGYSFGAGVVGGLANLIGLAPMNTIGKGIAKFTVQISIIAISIGVILYYVIPFLPFLYFMFSAGTWIKSLFQALVAMPLWALAHMSIDGEGLPGRYAMNGYFLLLEVFIRPILTVIGLLGGLLIFGAQAFVLNEIWDTVTTNITGANYAAIAPVAVVGTTTGTGVGTVTGISDTLSHFFFTVMYAIVLYMMALSSFKMADAVPDNIIRWIGASLDSFGQFDPNPAEGMVGRIATTTQLATGALNPVTGLLLSRNS